MARTAKNPSPLAEQSATELFSSADAQLDQIIQAVKALAVSDKHADPAWQADPKDPDASAPMIDTDPPTDLLGQARAATKVLKTKAKAEAKKYSGRAVKQTGVDLAARSISAARSAIAKAYGELQEAQRLLRQEQAQAAQDRKSYEERNRDKLAQKRRDLEAKQRRIARELADAS